MNGIRIRDLGRVFLWLLYYLAVLTPLFLAYWLAGSTSVFEYNLLWSLAGIASLLVLARKKGHGPLVLGLCCLIFWIKVEPFLGLYLLVASASLFSILHLPVPRQRLFFRLALFGFVILVPKCLPLFFSGKPYLWLWLRETLLLGFFLRYFCYEQEFREGRLKGHRFFEHLGYILFIPQLFQLLTVTPSGQLERPLEQPGNLWPAAKMFLLGSGKFILYQFHLIIPVGLQDGGAGSFLSAWYQIFTHYLLWFLWLSAHYDYAVALARLLGFNLPANFHFPLLASSPRSFWQRWLVLHHSFLKEWVFQPSGGNVHPARSIFLSFAVSALLFGSLWVGSYHWMLAPVFFWQWLPFFLLQALLVYLQFRFSYWPRSLFARGAGWIFTQTSFALCSLFLAGLHRFPLDTTGPGAAFSVLKKAFFTD